MCRFSSRLDRTVTHLVALPDAEREPSDKLITALRQWQSGTWGTSIVRYPWLAQCYKEKRLVPAAPHIIRELPQLPLAHHRPSFAAGRNPDSTRQPLTAVPVNVAAAHAPACEQARVDGVQKSVSVRASASALVSGQQGPEIQQKGDCAHPPSSPLEPPAPTHPDPGSPGQVRHLASVHTYSKLSHAFRVSAWMLSTRA